MRRRHSPSFEDLETRRLLSGVHHVPAHPATASVAVPLVLDGTLKVKAGSGSTVMNADGSSTEAIPVSGSVSTLGAVRGIWRETTDSSGNYQGPDTIRLNTAKGAVVIAFDNVNSGLPQHTGPGTGVYVHLQKVAAGSARTHTARRAA